MADLGPSGEGEDRNVDYDAV